MPWPWGFPPTASGLQAHPGHCPTPAAGSCQLPIAGRERDAIWDGPGSTGSVVVACPERLVGRYFSGSSIYKRKYQRTATGGHLPRLSRDWAQAGAGVADFLAPVNAAGCGCARVPDYADQRYWSRGAAVGGAWDR